MNTAFRLLTAVLLAAVLVWLASLPPSHAEEKAAPQEKAWWFAEVDQALMLAGDNRKELLHALTAIPAEQRPGLTFLLVNMPDHDLRSLKGDFLLENCDLSYKAREQVAWGKQIPDDVFFNNVLPYANVDEKRDPWRKELYDLCLPIVMDCKTPSEAAQKLNSTVFNKLKVRYGTGRKQPHQSPKESIEQGLASCTGLSILLSDACRSVAVPTAAGRDAVVGQQEGQSHLGRNLGQDLALHRRLRTRPGRPRSRLVRWRSGQGHQGFARPRHLCHEFSQNLHSPSLSCGLRTARTFMPRTSPIATPKIRSQESRVRGQVRFSTSNSTRSRSRPANILPRRRIIVPS